MNNTTTAASLNVAAQDAGRKALREKLINERQLLIYLDHCQLGAANGGRSFPGRRWLAERYGVTLRTIDRDHARLVAVGLLERVAVFNHHTGMQTTNSYYVCALRRAPKLPASHRKRTLAFERRHDRPYRAMVAAQRRQRLAAMSHQGRHRMSPPKVEKRVETSSRARSGPRTGVPTSVGEVFTALKKGWEASMTPPKVSVEPGTAPIAGTHRSSDEVRTAKEAIAQARALLRR